MKRDDAGAIASGAVVGAVLALMAILIWTEVSRPASFPTTTVAALPTPFAIPTPTPRPTVPLTLTPDGLGLVSFGQPGEATVDQLKAILGSPTSDDRWTCTEPAADVHFVQWAELGVFLIDNVFVGYVDAIYYPPQFGPLLGLETEDGVGIGLRSRGPAGSLWGPAPTPGAGWGVRRGPPEVRPRWRGRNLGCR
jgi:hypothetical protein